LYFLMVHILNDPSNFEDFSFLLNIYWQYIF
jgi:hypothetical protein